MLSKDKQPILNILHLNTYDISGGAARAVNRLHRGLLCLGFDSSMFVARKDTDDPTIKVFKPPDPIPMDFPGRLRRYLDRHLSLFRRCLGLKPAPISPLDFEYYQTSRPSGYELFSDGRSQFKNTLLSQLPHCDMINLHWIANFIDYQTFFPYLTQKCSIVWTLHDMNAFTGGCHYDHGCGKYNSGCGACPQLGSLNEKDLSNWIWQRKREIFWKIEPKQMHIVAPSRWLGRECKRSPLLGRFPVTVIPNGLDINDFSPRDRCFARDVLGIPQGSKTLLFAADSVNNRRKGFAFLAQALSGLADLANLFLITIGSGKPVLDTQIPQMNLGQIHNDRLLSLIYSAADIYVIPSVQDNLPNTVMESMACGTPVIGFDIGGIPDMVQPGVTGLLIPPKDVPSMSDAIRRLLMDEDSRFKISDNCRRITLKEYDLNIQAKRYIALYQNVLECI